ncbi:MAG: molybdopterin-synthase adenylyltransferase MoeB [Saprospiraceae bacterium]
MHLTPSELARYARHISIPEFGIDGQQRLKRARVLVVGSGGLGSPVLLYLAAAGVGHIGIVDFDRVDESNLQRQVLFGVADVGRSKAEAAQERLLALNPHISVQVYDTALTAANALDIIEGYDVVADGTDNFPTRYLVNDACVLSGAVNVYASIFRFEGQVSVFNYLLSDGTRGPNYRDMFPEPPPPGLVPSCAEGGVLGVLPGIIGSMQASEVIKVITGVGEPLVGRLFLFDAASFTTRILKVRPQPGTVITELIDYGQFCGISPAPSADEVRQISPVTLQAWRQAGRDFQLIDVREPYEVDIATIGGELIPVGDIPKQTDIIARDRDVVVYCRSGVRSANVIVMLQQQLGYTNLLNLEGGILAYGREVDPTIQAY